MKKRRKKQKKILKSTNLRMRILLIGILFGSFFLVLNFYLVKIFILDQAFYQEKLANLTDKTVYGESAPRGRIYDRNYNLLVDNVQVPTIYYEKSKDLTTNDEIMLARRLASILELTNCKLAEINLKEFYLREYPEEVKAKITEEEWQALEERRLSSRDIEKLELERITKEELSIYSDEDKEAAYLYYAMNKGYSYQKKILKENATKEEIAYVVEHSDVFEGVSVAQNWERVYYYGDTFKSILGTVSTSEQGLPSEERDYYLEQGYALNDRVGLSYLEKQYESLLKGEKAVYKVNSSNEMTLIKEAERGSDIVLTIDIKLQQEVDRILSEQLIMAKGEPNTGYFNRSFVVIQEPETGEILAMSGKQVVKDDGKWVIRDYTPGILTSPMTPGSVVKGATMLVGYNTGVLQIGEVIEDACVKIAGTPKKCSHANLGRINDITALAQSSNVYQFKIAMRVAGANYRYNQPLKINTEAFSIYRKTLGEFGLGVKTEIDLPIESLGYIGTKTDAGLLLDLSMGQYDTYTPIQLSQYITTLASNGKRLKPHLLKEVHAPTSENELGPITEKIEPTVLNTVTTEERFLNRIKEGFRAVMTVGLGKGVMGTSPSPAGKTGTSESFLDTDGDGVIDSESVSNAFVGFAPYDHPQMTIAVTSPDVEKPSSYSYHSYVNRRIAKEISSRFFELYTKF